MEIPELIVALELKRIERAENIKELERKLEMLKHDFDMQGNEIERVKLIHYRE